MHDDIRILAADYFIDRKFYTICIFCTIRRKYKRNISYTDCTVSANHLAQRNTLSAKFFWAKLFHAEVQLAQNLSKKFPSTTIRSNFALIIRAALLIF